MAYFSIWRPHGNRVYKTRFITLINIEKNLEHIREEPREEEEEEEEEEENKNKERRTQNIRET